ncbi:hypothetical protein D9756_010546 [Leucocoprinus leucothites]|uniref:Uncharacterized protein n=1 Tax=Leucocoprinus leucothites TaxID=201217 RepID=A0A8H5CSI9_9AGAR|nr:hypothetical protein D9756_010546 [Leucoagaricus leucothites]
MLLSGSRLSLHPSRIAYRSPKRLLPALFILPISSQKPHSLTLLLYLESSLSSAKSLANPVSRYPYFQTQIGRVVRGEWRGLAGQDSTAVGGKLENQFEYPEKLEGVQRRVNVDLTPLGKERQPRMPLAYDSLSSTYAPSNTPSNSYTYALSSLSPIHASLPGTRGSTLPSSALFPMTGPQLRIRIRLRTTLTGAWLMER